MTQIKIAGILSSALLLILFIFLWIENGLISPFLYFIGFFLGTLLILNQEKKIILISFFAFYSFWGITVTLILVQDPSTDFYHTFDSITFYELSNIIGNTDNFSEFMANFNDISIKYSDTFGWNFFLGLNSYIANIIDDNNVYIHVIVNSFIGSVSILIIYVILLENFSKAIAIKWTVLLGFFSFIPIFTPTLVRDVIIALLFLIAYKVTLHKTRYWILKVILIAAITSLFRPESGIVILGFLILIFKRIQLWRIGVVVIGVIVLMPVLSQYYERLISTYEVYNRYSEELNNPSGLGTKLLSLPMGLRELAVVTFSQIQPFPTFGVLYNLSEKSSSPFRFYEVIVSLIHVILWSFIVFSLFRKEIRKLMPREFVLLLILTVFFLAGSIYTFSHRRAFPMYPSIYLLSIWCYYKLDSMRRRNIIFFSVFGIISLNIIYFLIK
ncbi:hypothetical protein [Algoriphagus aquimarinus]|uniref:Glycosyltransferase RgtA/B/C/D-like domain-containing protein n=1 Tax=Algoriphagus aquimarinus TaxID=237018 RepID=A0A1I1AZH8_9BACT|nr:hypothetical protein [Algoriphagus aquimarinus]SFB41663.1 hypothetical protein SAMN04489723_109143 [Algoriphagus aquimarinus]